MQKGNTDKKALAGLLPRSKATNGKDLRTLSDRSRVFGIETLGKARQLSSELTAIAVGELISKAFVLFGGTGNAGPVILRQGK